MRREKRIKMMLEAEDIVLKDVPLIPLYYNGSAYLLNKRIKGLYLSPRKWDFFRGIEIVQ